MEWGVWQVALAACAPGGPPKQSKNGSRVDEQGTTQFHHHGVGNATHISTALITDILTTAKALPDPPENGPSLDEHITTWEQCHMNK